MISDHWITFNLLPLHSQPWHNRDTSVKQDISIIRWHSCAGRETMKLLFDLVAFFSQKNMQY